MLLGCKTTTNKHYVDLSLLVYLYKSVRIYPYVYAYVHVYADAYVYVCLLLFYVLSTSMVISGQVPTRYSAHSWCLYSAFMSMHTSVRMHIFMPMYF